jgi:hypothetical protein
MPRESLAGRGRRDTRYEMRDTRYEMRDTRYEMWDEGYEMDGESETGGTDDNSRIEISGTPHPVSRISHATRRTTWQGKPL